MKIVINRPTEAETDVSGNSKADRAAPRREPELTSKGPHIPK
jgi:hypothetical protein